MSEDSQQLPAEPRGSDQALNAPDPAATSEEQAGADPSVGQAVPAPAESIIPEQPRSEQFQYPPSPEYYAQMPVANPYGAPPTVPVTPPPYVPPVPAPGMPMFPPAVGMPQVPPPGYGYGYGYQFVPQARPLPLGQAIRELPQQYKKILFKPGARSFAEEQGKADWGIIWFQLLLMVVLQVICTIPLYIAYNHGVAGLFASSGPAEDAAIFSSPGILVGEIAFAIVLVPVAFFIWVGFQYLVARAFKGQGNFKQQAYNQLLFQAPLTIVSSLLVVLLTPVVGNTFASLNLSTAASGTISTVTPAMSGTLLLVSLLVDLISLAISVYTIILNVFSIMATHRMSGGKATGSVLIPYGAMMLIAFLFFICAFALVGAAAYQTMH